MTHLQTPPTPNIHTDTDTDERIRTAQTGVTARFAADLAKARSTITTTGRVTNGLACDVVQGRFNARLDLAPGMGGDATGPSPGFFARAAIAGCVAIAVKMLAARERVTLEAVDVSVETDFDDAALFGLGSGTASPLETRILIDVTTDAPKDHVRDIVHRALAMDPWFLALRDPQSVLTGVSVRTALDAAM
jgi:uncharacterized OsmC-like protein